MMNQQQLKIFLDKKVGEYNTIEFIEDDPISIPHRFTKKQDIEIAAFFAAIFAWGQRKTIINKCNELIELFDNEPHDFISNFSEKDLQHLQHFKHRTFNFIDLKYFLQFLKYHYQQYDLLESAFIPKQKTFDVKDALIHFHQYFFSLHNLQSRTRKHIATPLQNSTCKRLNMFLRWMVRKDNSGVDFGIWKKIKPSQLYCPLDLHVDRVARSLNLIQRKQNDWQTVEELTANLKLLDTNDPVKYDFALFGLGVSEKINRV
jgi:uncharacterized protein (TIGR02757 family)